MRVRFTRPARADLIQIQDYVSRYDPKAASRVIARLMEISWSLEHLPEQGRQTDEPGTLLLVVPQLRYFIFYRIVENEVQVLHVRHMSRSRFWR
ncbi:type II toxin-antitoxin system RelE/ParE family toxin [Bradyrhizobium guangzhouense]|uniref:Type II toxin-antitoxin system RelE/ParE family toxin n=1 Tax=Bradyrhizobium guangzhouense TaxID=1325095 RepID=A0ABY0E7P8_9BRAD|nr:type II toxin-antitoxin system RelE/ParE family toxin [Bradyrhizobium guangzhouense]